MVFQLIKSTIQYKECHMIVLQYFQTSDAIFFGEIGPSTWSWGKLLSHWLCSVNINPKITNDVRDIRPWICMYKEGYKYLDSKFKEFSIRINFERSWPIHQLKPLFVKKCNNVNNNMEWYLPRRVIFTPPA